MCVHVGNFNITSISKHNLYTEIVYIHRKSSRLKYTQHTDTVQCKDDENDQCGRKMAQINIMYFIQIEIPKLNQFHLLLFQYSIRFLNHNSRTN